MEKHLQPSSNTTYAGDLIQLVGARDKSYIFPLKLDQEFQSHLGIIPHNDLIGLPWGTRVKTHLGKVFILLQPALDDLLRQIKRETQIMYPKDIGYILVTMGIGPGSQVIEAGTGSGAFTTALAYSVGPSGHVFSFEKKEKNLQIAQANLKNFGLEKRVTLKHHDIIDGFGLENFNNLFLDLPNPYDYVSQVREALMPGGFFGSFVPTANQVSDLITALKKENFSFIEVSEMLHRYYKPSATRLRPVDRMVAHTGYLVFARRITSQNEVEDMTQ